MKYYLIGPGQDEHPNLDLQIDARLVGESSEACDTGFLCTTGKQIRTNGFTTLVNKTACLGSTAAPSEMLRPCSGSLAPHRCHQPSPGMTQAGSHQAPTACSSLNKLSPQLSQSFFTAVKKIGNQ